MIANVLTGFLHPFLGPDRLLAMLASGMWARTQSGRKVFLVPGGCHQLQW